MDHENIWLSEISQTKTNTVGYNFYVGSKITELIETENRLVVVKDRGIG